MERKEELIKKLFTTNPIISETYGKIGIETVMGNINRIERFHENPTKADLAVGIEQIMKDIDEKLNQACIKVQRIAREFYKETGMQLIEPVQRNGKIIKPEEMTRQEKIDMFLEFAKLDVTNDDARREFLDE